MCAADSDEVRQKVPSGCCLTGRQRARTLIQKSAPLRRPARGRSPKHHRDVDPPASRRLVTPTTRRPLGWAS
jgi:hypothetical protein